MSGTIGVSDLATSYPVGLVDIIRITNLAILVSNKATNSILAHFLPRNSPTAMTSCSNDVPPTISSKSLPISLLMIKKLHKIIRDPTPSSADTIETLTGREGLPE